jgi:hypothetical protein
VIIGRDLRPPAELRPHLRRSSVKLQHFPRDRCIGRGRSNSSRSISASWRTAEFINY